MESVNCRSHREDESPLWRDRPRMGPSCSSLCLSSTVQRSGALSEREAFAIATAWHSQLHSLLRHDPVLSANVGVPLDNAVVLDDQYSIIPSVEFIAFAFTSVDDRDLDHVVLAARAATIAWFALTCCPGFGGHENPQFWWRVLLASTTSTTPEYDPTMMSHGMTMNATRQFPNIRVEPPHLHHVSALRLFLFGAEKNGRRPRMRNSESKFAVALRMLEPYICDERWSQDLCVAVRSSQFDTIAELLADTSTRFGDYNEVARLSKPLRIAEVHCNHDSQITMASMNALLKADPVVRVVLIDSNDARSVIDYTPRRRLGSEIQWLSRIPRIQIRTLTLLSPSHRAEGENSSFFHTCCSDLPFTRSIQSVRVDARRKDAALTQANDAWLGFAIFHPDIEAGISSSFTDMTLTVGTATPSILHTLSLMAQGNNLLVASGVTTIVNKVYHQVRLRAGVCVKVDTTEGPSQQKPFAFEVNNSETWYSACFPNPNEVSQSVSEDYVGIIMPGVGIGWVHSSNVLELRALPPRVSRVQRLRLVPSSAILHCTMGVHEAAVGTLSVLGRQLTFLDIGSIGYVSATTLSTILRVCPELKALRVRHDGSCLSNPTGLFVPSFPRLHQLELILVDNEMLQPLRAPQLSALKVFQVIQKWPGSFDPSRHTLRSVLERCPYLETVVWRPRGVTLTSETAMAPLLRGVVLPGIHDVTRVQLCTPARVAFLSVNRAAAVAQSQNPLGRLGDPNITRHIFSFSLSYGPRKFHLAVAQ